MDKNNEYPNTVEGRIAYLRKEILHITQLKMATKLNLAVSTISTYENSSKHASKTVILGICREYNVREEWLRTGEGEIFKETKAEGIDFDTEIEKIAEEKGLKLNESQKYFLRTIAGLREDFYQIILAKAIELVGTDFTQEVITEPHSGHRYDEDRKDAHRQLDANFDKLEREQEKGIDKDFGTESAS
ncbi:hypothetical protein FACS1894188_03660 [Clostridia bacterium]|nr:hypothetical protein FACS1894188_03660 [Clostridia bacterium]